MRTKYLIAALLAAFCLHAQTSAQSSNSKIEYYWVTQSRVLLWSSPGSGFTEVEWAGKEWKINSGMKYDELEKAMNSDLNDFLSKLRDNPQNDNQASPRTPDAEVYLRVLSDDYVTVSFLKDKKLVSTEFKKQGDSWRKTDPQFEPKLFKTMMGADQVLDALFETQQVSKKPKDWNLLWTKWINEFINDSRYYRNTQYEILEKKQWLLQERLNKTNDRELVQRFKDQFSAQTSGAKGDGNGTGTTSASGWWESWWLALLLGFVVGLPVTKLVSRIRKKRGQNDGEYKETKLSGCMKQVLESLHKQLTSKNYSQDTKLLCESAAHWVHSEYTKYLDSTQSAKDILAPMEAYLREESEKTPQDKKDLIALGEQTKKCVTELKKLFQQFLGGPITSAGSEEYIKELPEKVKSLLESNSDLKKSNETLTSELNTATADRDALSAQVTNKSGELAQSQKENSDLRTENSSLKKDKEGLDKMKEVIGLSSYLFQGQQFYLGNHDPVEAAPLFLLINYSLFELCVAAVNNNKDREEAMMCNLYSISKKVNLTGFDAALKEIAKKIPDFESIKQELISSRKAEGTRNDRLFPSLIKFIRSQTKSSVELAPFFFIDRQTLYFVQ